MISIFLKLLIKIYQATLSPDHGMLSFVFPGRVCRHSPTCSQYAYYKIEELGPIKGLYLAIRRIIKCNPYTN